MSADPDVDPPSRVSQIELSFSKTASVQLSIRFMLPVQVAEVKSSICIAAIFRAVDNQLLQSQVRFVLFAIRNELQFHSGCR